MGSEALRLQVILPMWTGLRFQAPNRGMLATNGSYKAESCQADVLLATYLTDHAWVVAQEFLSDPVI